ncbi:hypothetical protein AB0C15_26750 [Micromonospora sp. NPDC048835]|uniref:hypothetical protein n=1 Tax=Micromonospora sp. NPDC048835 TaxID=3155147 RepID=UPI0033D624D7
MSNNGMAQAQDELPTWASDSHQNFEEFAQETNAPVQALSGDPIALVPYVQVYLSGLPLAEFTQDDWVTLHTDLASFLAELMIRNHAASWVVREAPSSPRGFRYVLAVDRPLAGSGVVDPFEVVASEFRSPPIEVARMIATAELTAGVTRRYDQ